MKRVFILFPIDESNTLETIQRAQRIAELAIRGGMAPVIPQVYLLQYYDSKSPQDRRLFDQLTCAIMQSCDLVWMWGALRPEYSTPLAVAADCKIPIYPVGQYSDDIENEQHPRVKPIALNRREDVPDLEKKNMTFIKVGDNNGIH